jgi:transposase
MNPSGHFVPPFFIFPRQRMNERLMIGAPDDAVAAAQSNGWIRGETFLIWLQHFVQHVQPTPQKPVLLILDGHSSHKELAVMNYAIDNNIHMISTPPHTTHKLQPLDRTFTKPFKTAYSEACGLWMRQNPGLRITEQEVAALVSSAYTKICRLDIARNGFSCTGIHALNP